MSIRLTKVSASKLKKVLSEKTPTKKIKALSGFIVSGSKDEVSSFFIENSATIFALINERFGECETAPKPVRKGKHYTPEVIQLLQVVKKYVEVCLPDQNNIAQDLHEMLRKVLGYGNKHVIRSTGYEILLVTIDILYHGKQSYAEFLPMLADGINFIPFYPEDQTSVPPQTFHPKSLAPATTMPSIEESVELWDYFCDFMLNSGNFSFWFELFQKEYLPTLFPHIAKKMNIPAKENSFLECPPQLQKILITHITIWMENNATSPLLWKPPNGQLLLDICKCNCQLPVEYADSATSIIERLRKFFLEKAAKSPQQIEEIGGNALFQGYLRDFMQNISLVFLTKSTPETLEVHNQLGQKVLTIYRTIISDHFSLLDQTSWVCLQDTMLKLVNEVLGSSNPFSINHISTISANEIFRHLFLIWIKSPHTTKDMWSYFSQTVSKMVHWNELLNQWKDKTIQLTHMMIGSMFEAKIKIKEAEEQRKQSRQLRTMTDYTVKTNASYDVSIQVNEGDPQIKELWHTILHILGNLNAITNPENFTTGLNCCAEIIDILLNTEDKLEVECTKVIEVYHIFLPWLLEACMVEEKRNRGRLIAYSTLCKLYCRPQAAALPLEILCHFYRIVKQGLNSNHSSVIWTILRYASLVFTLSLPGANILISDFLREIMKILTTKSKTTVPTDVINRAICLVTSLICFPDHFPGVIFSSKDDEEELNSDTLREKISSILITALQYDKISANNLSILQYSITVLVMNDLLNTKRKTTIRECIKGILFCCNNNDKRVSLAALESLSTLKECYNQLFVLDFSLISVLVYTLAENINNLVKQCKQDVSIIPEKEELIVQHFYCLLDWLLVTELKNIDFACLLEVFEAVELCLLGDLSINETSSTKEPQKKKNFIDRLGKSFNPSKDAKIKQKAAVLLDNLSNSDFNQFSDNVHEAAEIFLLNLLVKYSNYPSPEGATEGSSNNNGESHTSTLYFIYNQKSIFSFTELPSENGGRFVRLVIRDGTGKYTWDSEILHTPSDLNVNVSLNEKKSLDNAEYEDEIVVAPSIHYTRNVNDLPFYRDGQSTEGVDMANELLTYLGEISPQLVPSGKQFQDKHEDKIKTFKEIIQHQEDDQLRQMKEFDLNQRTPLPLFPTIQTPISTFHYCRLFISQMGFLSESQRRCMSFLTASSRFKRSLSELDKINARDMVKIGLLYVKEGQDNQNDILTNEIASERYTKFVEGLGWCVNLKTHKAYKGGLDSRTAGTSAVYYANPLYEVIFHDTSRMPNAKDDKQQIQKKRHVGNDNVQVIWSEHYRDYDPSTITSQFNDAHIIIYPLVNGLHRIQIFQKEKLPSFGPLQTGMLITKKLLTLLVRCTSVNANSACRSTSELYRKPYSVRLDLIQEISRRYKCEKLFADYVSELIPSPLEQLNPNPGLDDDDTEVTTTNNSGSNNSNSNSANITFSPASPQVTNTPKTKNLLGGNKVKPLAK